MVNIRKLSRRTLPQASALADSVFPSEPTPPSQLFEESLSGKNPGKLLFEYYVALDSTGAVVGTSGLYELKRNSKTGWLGWFCVAPHKRGLGIGQSLLDHTIKQAREKGKSFLRLYTSTSPHEAAAQKIYEKNGFHIVRTAQVKSSPHKRIYRELAL